MDRKGIAVIAACLVFMVGYYIFMQRSGMNRVAPAPTSAPTAADTSRAIGPPPDTTGVGKAVPASPPPVLVATDVHPPAPTLARISAIETPLYRAEFTDHGARLQVVELKRFAMGSHPAGGKPVHIPPGQEVPPDLRVMLAGSPSFALDLGSGKALRRLDDVTYAVQESLDAAGDVKALTFTGQTPEGVRIRQTYRVRPDDYALDLEVEMQDVPRDGRIKDYSLSVRSWPLIDESNPVDEVRSLRVTSLLGSNLIRDGINKLRGEPHEGNALWTAVQTRYFAGAVAVKQGSAERVIPTNDRRTLPPQEARLLPPGMPPEQVVAVSSLVVSLPGETNPIHRYLLYFGPNDYFRVSKYGIKLERLVDLGWSWILPFSKALLQLLIWLHGLVQNYGVAILLLATVVRIVLHPLNMMSMKSMRAMQKLQPEMDRLRAKYKNDPQALNTAIMSLYRDNKVNPAGGCLPMLLQMPLFVGLYSVLANAVELRQAPFVGWIHDLSAPDVLFEVAGFPIRLLPIVMAGTGALSQYFTPTDPRQANTMMMMNLVMVVLFYNLPSGLVLYWTVMNLLTALQQWLVLRGDGSAPVPASGGAAVARKAAGK